MKTKHQSFVSHFIFRNVFVLFFAFYLSVSPAFFTAIDMLEEHGIVCEMFDEEETKEKVLFSLNNKLNHHNYFIVQKKSSTCTNNISTDFKPEVPIPPPKQA